MRKKLLSSFLALALLLTALAVPALAQKAEKTPPDKPKETQAAKEPQETESPKETETPKETQPSKETQMPGKPPSSGGAFSGDSDLVTRDLLYDKEGRKQFISVQDRAGNLFYIIIDYDAPVNQEEEQYKTYFLNPVDPEDLAALTGQEPTGPVLCTCREKCKPGKVDLTCPVCSTNMAECAGEEPEQPTQPPAEQPREPDTPAQEPDRRMMTLAGVLLLGTILAAAAVVVIRKGRKRPSGRPDPDDEEETPQDPDNPELLPETEQTDRTEDDRIE